jgi:pimeloyl-ACP methyl ester carboxylesterase
MELLAPRFHVLAPDSYGVGRSPPWPQDGRSSLRDEVDLIEPVIARAGSPFALVGHSYGAAVALIAALRHRDAVRALVLYEPTLFALVDAHSPPPNDADGVRRVICVAEPALDAGDIARAAEAFIDYWMGEGSLARMPAERRSPVVDSVKNLRRWYHALSTEPATLAQFAQIDVPVLYILGERAPASVPGVARQLAPPLPRARVVTLEGIGHMGPITHPDVVNQAVARFLDDVS